MNKYALVTNARTYLLYIVASILNIIIELIIFIKLNY